MTGVQTCALPICKGTVVNTGATLVRQYWIDPERVRRRVALEVEVKSRNGKLLASERNELIAFKET